MIRGKYLRERKAIRVKRRFKCLIVLAIILIIYKVLFDSYSLFESEASSAANIDIAFFAVEDNYESNLINLGNLEPGETKKYIFSVSNFITVTDEEGTEQAYPSETDIDYTLKIRSTTNLPLKYELYVGESESLGTDKSINMLTQDNHNTYFNDIFEDKGTFEMDKCQSNNYTLIITYPKGTEENPNKYTSSEYQNIIDCVEISLDSKQKID